MFSGSQVPRGAMGDLRDYADFPAYAEREGLETQGWLDSTLQRDESTQSVTMSGASLLPSQFVAVQPQANLFTSLRPSSSVQAGSSY